jgi:hypothetical protein
VKVVRRWLRYAEWAAAMLELMELGDGRRMVSMWYCPSLFRQLANDVEER